MLTVDQVPVAVAAAWFQGNHGPPDIIVTPFKPDTLNRPLSELPAQHHARGLNVSGKGEGDIDEAGCAFLLARNCVCLSPAVRRVDLIVNWLCTWLFVLITSNATDRLFLHASCRMLGRPHQGLTPAG